MQKFAINMFLPEILVDIDLPAIVVNVMPRDSPTPEGKFQFETLIQHTIELSVSVGVQPVNEHLSVAFFHFQTFEFVTRFDGVEDQSTQDDITND